MMYQYGNLTDFSILLGKTITAIEVEESKEIVVFTLDNGDQYAMLHLQDCCEHVYLEDVDGDVNDLLGEPVLLAEEVTEQDDKSDWECRTWTFYKLSTVKASVTFRWEGTSNGYYSEEAHFVRIPKEKL
jgi:hypothetical protein